MADYELQKAIAFGGIVLPLGLGCADDSHSFRDYDTVSLPFYDHGECPDAVDADGIGICVDGFSRANDFRTGTYAYSSAFALSYDVPAGGGIIYDSDSRLRLFPRFETSAAGYMSNPERAADSVDSVVVHNCDSSFEVCVQTFESVAEAKGIHFVISQAGQVYQVADFTKSTIHATYYNRRSIGIELEGSVANMTYSSAMMQSLAQVLSLIHDALPSVPLVHPTATATVVDDEVQCLDVAGIVGHEQVQPIEELESLRYSCRTGIPFANSRIAQKLDPNNFDSRWNHLITTAQNLSSTRSQAPRLTVYDVWEFYQNPPWNDPVTVPARGFGITATGGTGGVPAIVVPFCNDFTYTGGGQQIRGYLRMLGGDQLVFRCGSLEFGATSGTPEIVLSEAAVLKVAAGASVTIDQVGDGVVTIDVDESSTAPVVYELNGEPQTLEPGTTLETEVPQGTNNPPVCNEVPPIVVWPPNRKFVPINLDLSLASDPDDDLLTFKAMRITQDEVVLDDEISLPDATGLDTAVPQVRAEMAGSGNGRVYHIEFSASDGSASCTGVQQVHVPHSRRVGAVDDGQLYDSTNP
jgi:hypothetical protein